MAGAGTKRRSTRQAASRKRSQYVDPDTDDDFQAESDGEADFQPVMLPAHTSPARKKRKVVATRSRAKTRSKSKPTNPRKGVFRPLGKIRKPRSEEVVKHGPTVFTGPSDGRIPAWTSLPIAVLRDIFVFASEPLEENAEWLLKAARTCRAFAEPALEAFYYSPRLLTTLHPHHLLELLRLERPYINYKTKIKRLDIDIRRLGYTAHNRPLFDLARLVECLPQLKHLEITEPVDLPPYREIQYQSWTYPKDLFESLEMSQTRLNSWRWSRNMLKDRDIQDIFPLLASIHESKPFESLQRLVICGFHTQNTAATSTHDDKGETLTIDLPFALAKLSNLRNLTFISCSIVEEQLLKNLPPSLHRLELSNCHEFNSDMLANYLNTSGSSLEALILNHNPALDLAFLPDLAKNCPRLQILHMDLHFYSERHAVNDAEPLYDELLQADEIPTWPTTLRHIHLVHLQKWAADASVNMFRSLVDSAPSLPDLRHLTLQAHINIPWRDRAGFRDEWIERLTRVYLRRAKLPNPYHGSRRQFELWKQARAKANGSSATAEVLYNVTAAAANTSVQVEIPPHKPSGYTEVNSDVDDAAAATTSRPAPTRRSRRVIATHNPSTSLVDDGSETATSPTASEGQEEEEGREFIQGLCDVVDLRIDNQRPRENQFTERDFLDSEISGDEDWDEDAEGDGEEGYAW